MSWVITKDHVSSETYHPMTEPQIERAEKTLPYQFKLYDSDGELYFEGLSDDSESYYPLDWAIANHGCTDIEYLEDGNWVAL